MVEGKHLTPEGLRKIVAIRARMNRGLSEKLKVAFPDVVPVVRPLVENPKILDPNWLAGFTSAEGCFYILITKSTTKIGFQVKRPPAGVVLSRASLPRLVFGVTQHSRDENLMKSFINYFRCGNYFVRANHDFGEFQVTKFSDITGIIIPFFKKYPIIGVKALDFADWCEVAEMMKDKKHLIAEGLEKIKKIKARMNTGRK